MNRKIVAYCSLALFCIVGVVVSTVAAARFNIFVSIIFLCLFTAGFFVCTELLAEVFWKQQQDKNKNG